ncbi:MAG TPA: carboxypeptidase regulatory-like domain-containing protein, partial [Edaphobacter sp.]|nr:carboxypeptidase regulatory-like domain-containing protein [Edaphobacter sp.]
MKNAVKLLILILGLFAATTGNAQNYETTLTGTVLDTTGAIVSNAVITIVNVDTNATRKTSSTGTGSYYVGSLPIGRYNVKISAENFATTEIKDIQLVVGQTRQLDVRLNIGAVVQEVKVEDNAPALQTTTAEIGAVIQNQQIKDLPLNGRNVASLLALVPGAIDSGGGTLSTIRFAGRGNDDTNFRLDGVDATGIRAQNPNATLRLVTSTESISELKVATLLYGADTGGTAGGQVELVSKSGTNEFHGGVFDFFRNNWFDSNGPFDAKTPPLKLNDFGASLGGPIIKDKTFFFGVYEGLRQTVAANLIGVVPTDSYRAAVLATSPALAPFLNAYPHGNGAALDANRINYSSPTATRQTEDSYLFRVQHIFNDKNSAFVRYNIDHANITGPSGALRDLAITNTSPMNATVQYVHVFTPTLVNEAAIGFNRQWSVASTAGYLTSTQSINYALSVSGFTALANTKASESAPTTYSLLDNLTKTFGRHSIKTGFELKELQFNYSQAGTHQLQYNGVTQFQNNKLDSVSVVADVPVHGLHKLMTFAYVQDTYKLRPNLTLTYGLRYAFLNVLHEVQGRSRAWDDVTCGGNCPVGGQFTIPVYTDFEPRFSFGWEPAFLHGKTSLR